MPVHRLAGQVLRRRTRQFSPCAFVALALWASPRIGAQAPTPIWSAVSRTSEAVVEIDRARIHRVTSTIADAWTRVTYAQPDTLPEGDVYTSFIQHALYDCQHRRYRPAQMVVFDRTGRIIKVMERNPSPDWVQVPPGTVADAQAKGACGVQLG